MLPLLPSSRDRYWRSLLVAFEMQGQVIRAREAALAVDALERLGARVLAIVARQFVAARKSPQTALPRAVVRLLNCRTRNKNKS